MEGNVSAAQAVTAPEAALPQRVQEALGQLVGAAQEGLLALSVGVGLDVLAELAKGRHHRRVRDAPNESESGMGPFGIWLTGQRHRDDPVGVLARDAQTDPRWPSHAQTLNFVETYLKHDRGAPESLLRAARQAWAEYEAS